MHRTLLSLALAFAFVAAPPAFATDPAPARASDADIQRLLEVMDMKTMMADMMRQMSEAQRPMLMEAFGQELSDADRQRMERLLVRVDAITQKHMDWSALEPIVREVYARVFDAREVAAMTAFHSTPEGASILRKSPQAAALTMQELQPIMVAAMQEVQTVIATEIEASKK